MNRRDLFPDGEQELIAETVGAYKARRTSDRATGTADV